jgi:hypothetical protein
MRTPDAATILGAGRITVFGIWFVDVLTAPLGLYAQLPSDLFSPPGLLRAVPAPVYQTLAEHPVLLVGLKAILLVGCLLLVLGVRPFRPIAIPITVLLVLFDGLVKGFNGFLNHAQLGILFAAVILCLFPAADALSVFGRRRPAASEDLYRGGILAVAAFLTAAYAFIGTHRVVHSGFAVFTGDAILIHMAVQSLQYSAYGFQLGLVPLIQPWLGPLFKLGYAVTTAFEIGSPLCLVSRWFRWIWLVVIVPFHVSTLLTMNIFFWENILLIFVFIAPLGLVLAPSRRDTTASVPALTTVGDPATAMAGTSATRGG